jgi:hypothetical protein
MYSTLHAKMAIVCTVIVHVQHMHSVGQDTVHLSSIVSVNIAHYRHVHMSMLE